MKKERTRNENGYGRCRTKRIEVRISSKEWEELQSILYEREKKWVLSDLIRTLIHDEFMFGRHRES